MSSTELVDGSTSTTATWAPDGYVGSFLGGLLDQPDETAVDMGGTTSKTGVLQEGCLDFGSESMVNRHHHLLRGSDRQLRDVVSVVQVQRPTLDFDYLEHWASEVGIADQLQAALDASA